MGDNSTRSFKTNDDEEDDDEEDDDDDDDDDGTASANKEWLGSVVLFLGDSESESPQSSRFTPSPIATAATADTADVVVPPAVVARREGGSILKVSCNGAFSSFCYQFNAVS